MRLSRIVPVLLLLLVALVALAPSANACIQVYPYSEICRHGPVGFVLGLLP